MLWGRALPQASSFSTIGDRALLDTHCGGIAASRRVEPCVEEYCPAAPAGRYRGRRRSLPFLRALARELAHEPCGIRAGRNTAGLAADKYICSAPAGPHLGNREPGWLLDNAHRHLA